MRKAWVAAGMAGLLALSFALPSQAQKTDDERDDQREVAQFGDHCRKALSTQRTRRRKVRRVSPGVDVERSSCASHKR